MLHRPDLTRFVAAVAPERAAEPVDGASCRRALIVKLSSIGDVVHAMPAAMALKASFPAMRITWAVDRAMAPLLDAHPAVDRVVVFPGLPWRRGWIREYRGALAVLREEPYDAALDLQGLARSAHIAIASRAPVRLARAGQREGAQFVSRAVPIARGIHAVEEYLAVAAWMGARTSPVAFGLAPRPGAIAAVRRMLADAGIAGDAPLVVNAAASSSAKDWPAGHWAAALDAMPRDVPIVLAGGAPSRAAHATIAGRMKRRAHDLTGRTTLQEMTALLALARLHVAPDTGTLHMAAALGTPSVGVYGPTSPVRLRPFAGGEAIHHPAACGIACPGYCLRRHACLSSIAPDEVIAAIERQLVAHGSGRLDRDDGVADVNG